MEVNREFCRGAVTAIGLPRDVLLGDALISFIGCCQIQIENYRGILCCTDTQIRIQANNCRIVLNGTGLFVSSYDRDIMQVSGRISSLEFEPS